MECERAKILLYGYGNPGRLDDGLGPALAATFEHATSEWFTVEANYQLTVEDAQLVAEHDVVIFADASLDGPEPFSLARVRGQARSSFSTHSLSPAAVLGLAHELFAAKTRGYLLALRGYRFDEFGEELSSGAKANLDAARTLIKEMLHHGDLALLDTHVAAREGQRVAEG